MSLENHSAEPPAFKVQSQWNASVDTAREQAADVRRKKIVQVTARTLTGMQKEALVSQIWPSGSTWRLVSDEGAYLQGSDLAPFPLAFFTAGQLFDLTSRFLYLAQQAAIPVQALEVVQDNWYTMSGSVLRGDISNGAQSVDVLVRVSSTAPAETVARLIELAERQSPAHAIMRDVLRNTFALSLNGRLISLSDLAPSPTQHLADPRITFEHTSLEPPATTEPRVVRKEANIQASYDTTDSIERLLQNEQRQRFRVHGEATFSTADGWQQARINLFLPRTSCFRFLNAETPMATDAESAPSALAYLSAGICFCYMTQLSRYAHTLKQKVHNISIVQRTVYLTEEPSLDEAHVAGLLPVDTHVFIEADESEEAIRKLLLMAERMCFLHGAMKACYPTHLGLEINGSVYPFTAGL